MHGTIPDAGWTDERISLLKSLYADGLSASQIAAWLNAQTGSSFTRSAVIGKVSRLGLPSRARRSIRVSTDPAQIRRRKENQGKTFEELQALGIAPTRVRGQRKPRRDAPRARLDDGTLPPLDASFNTTAFGQPCSLVELTDQTCRWPIHKDGEPALFCGALPSEGLPYCEGHCQVAYNHQQTERSRVRGARA